MLHVMESPNYMLPLGSGIRKYAGEKEISRIISELQGLYYRKPAFMDELRKISK
ncbi:hypothetical protein JMA_35480 [Jeotgalibacillus malaysiensis]|uniref:Uncharacterized protein n=1 Tax=Jeotgalibacillus malaysiensis TaxID=1508404 RepID=A0A0B5ARI9_9BACL|nr:hypothetical protein JMA_35480 [Jeotgalibacillus malaysiensis]